MHRTEKQRLADEIVELMGHLNAAGYRLLKLIARMDELLDLFDGVKSTAHWLNWRCGISMPAAHEKVRVARALRELPKTAAAFERGALSYSKVRAITRVATPFIEEDLLEIARYGTAAQLDKVVRGYRSATREEQQRRRERRSLEHYLDEDGMLVVRGCFTPEDGAVVRLALEQALRTLRSDRVGEENTAHARSTTPCRDGHEETQALGAEPEFELDLPDEEQSSRKAGAWEEFDGEEADCTGSHGTEPDGAPPSGDSSAGDQTPVQAGDERVFDAPVHNTMGAAGPSSGPDGPGHDESCLHTQTTHSPAEDSGAFIDGSTAPGWQRDWPFNPSGAERADAFTLMARSFLANGPPAKLRGEPCEVIVHVDWQALSGAGMAFYEPGTGLAPDEVRRLTCDASVVPIVEGPGVEGPTVEGPGNGMRGGEPLSTGRKRRTVPTGMRRALESRDQSCQFPSCNQRRHLHAHHIQHWADGGETALENLTLLCGHHHRLVHDGSFHLQRLANGRLRFLNTHGQVMPAVVPQPVQAGPGANGLARLLARHGVTVEPGTADSEWRGDRLDLHYVVQGLFEADLDNRRRAGSEA